MNAREAAEPRTWHREFEEVALVHRERLYRLALRLCRNRTDAEDLVQEAFLRALGGFHRFTLGTNGFAWLATILRNTFINHVTRGGRMVPLGDETAIERALATRDGGSRVPTPEQEFFGHAIDDRRLVAGLEGLPWRFREVLLLADVGGLAYREIAQLCELPVGTVMSRLFRAPPAVATGAAGPRRDPGPPPPRSAQSRTDRWNGDRERHQIDPRARRDHSPTGPGREPGPSARGRRGMNAPMRDGDREPIGSLRREDRVA
jgi:RNA polymerase sigma-70 factor (ECF subfamily)